MNNKYYTKCISCGLVFLVSSSASVSYFNSCDEHWYCDHESREQPHIHNETFHPINLSLLDSTFTVSALATMMDEKTARMVKLGSLF